MERPEWANGDQRMLERRELEPLNQDIIAVTGNVRPQNMVVSEQQVRWLELPVIIDEDFRVVVTGEEIFLC